MSKFSPFMVDMRSSTPAGAMSPDVEGFYKIKIVDGYDANDGARRVLVGAVVEPAIYKGFVIQDGTNVALDPEDEAELTKFAAFWLAILISVGYTEDQAKKKVMKLQWKNFADKFAYVYYTPARKLSASEKARGEKSYSNTKWLSEAQYKSGTDLAGAVAEDDSVTATEIDDDEPEVVAPKPESKPKTTTKRKRGSKKEEPKPEPDDEPADDDGDDDVDPLDAIEDLI